MRRTAIAMALAAATALPALAESNIDGRWRGSVSAGLSYSSGNTDEVTLSLAADAARATATNKISLAATARGGRSGKGDAQESTAELFKAGGRYDHDLTPRHFGFAGLDLEHDGLQELDLRTSLNTGLGWHAIKEERDTLDLFAGIGASRESYESLTRDFTELVLGEESSHQLTQDTTIKQKLSLYPNLEESGEYRVAFDATLAAAIASGWTFNVTLSSRYVSNPLPGLENSDTLLLVGVGGRFGP